MFVLFLIYLNIHRSFRISFIFRLRMIVTGLPGWLILLASVTWPQLSTGIYLSIYLLTTDKNKHHVSLTAAQSTSTSTSASTRRGGGGAWCGAPGATSRPAGRCPGSPASSPSPPRPMAGRWGSSGHTLLMQYPHSHNPPGPLTLVLSECIPVSDLRGGADGRVQPEHDETLRARRAAHSNNTVMRSGSPPSSQSRILSRGCVSQVSKVRQNWLGCLLENCNGSRNTENTNSRG